MTSTQLSYQQHGDPLQVLQAERICLPDSIPPQHLRLRLAWANILPSDLGLISGTYGKSLPLPRIAGREAVATIQAIGPDCQHPWQAGDLIRLPEELGAWQSDLDLPEKQALALKLPRDLDPQQAVLGHINLYSALRLLNDSTPLQSGDWILQNAANASVSIATAQIARHRGYRTIGLVRRPELIEALQPLGYHHVLLDNDDAPKTIRALTQGQATPLALNSIGGPSVLRLAKSLSPQGTLVTFGGMTGEPVRWPTRQLIFHNLRLTGFWMDAWLQQASPHHIQSMQEEAWQLIRQKIVQLPCQASYPLAQYQEALTHAQKPRLGKILFTP